MPYKSIVELPPAVKDALPAEAQRIFLRAFDAAYNEYGKSEERAFAVAWAAVKKAGYRKGKDGWTKVNSNHSIKVNRARNEDIGYAWQYKDVVVTKQGVMNGRFKSNEMIDNMKLPKIMPIFVDHPDDLYDVNSYYSRPLIGVGMNGRCNTDGPEHKIVYDFNIFKEYPITNERISDEEMVELSIEYAPGDDIPLESPKEYNGVPYVSIETSDRLYSTALMDTQEPACSCKDGCGIPSDKLNKEVCNMADEAPKQNNLELTSTAPAVVPVPTPEPVAPAPVPQPELIPEPADEKKQEQVAPVEEPKKPCPHIEQIANLEKAISDKEAEIMALKKKVDEMIPGYNMFVENKKKQTEMNLKIIHSDVPMFNSSGMSDEQIEQVALAINMRKTEEAKNMEATKRMYGQVNSVQPETNKPFDIESENRKWNNEYLYKKTKVN